MSAAAKRPAYKVAHIDEIPFEEGESPGTEWKPMRRFFDDRLLRHQPRQSDEGR